jgi:trans-aconitate methyltransferase
MSYGAHPLARQKAIILWSCATALNPERRTLNDLFRNIYKDVNRKAIMMKVFWSLIVLKRSAGSIGLD